MRGIGSKNANTETSEAKMTSPTKIFPKRRNENEMILVNSETSSKMPTYKLSGFREKYRPRYCFSPKVCRLITWVATSETRASASVTFKSVEALRKKGI